MMPATKYRLILLVGVATIMLICLTCAIRWTYGREKKPEQYTMFGTFYRAINDPGSGKSNVVWSPLGLKLLLAVFYAEATGDTSTEIRRSLEWSGKSEDENLRELKSTVDSMSSNTAESSDINFLTVGFTDEKFGNIVGSCKKQRLEMFNVFIQQINLEDVCGAVATVNSRVKRETGGRITSLLSVSDYNYLQEAPGRIKMIVANVFYFEVEWEKPFILASTKITRPFYTDNSKKNHVPTPFMSATGQFYHADIRELNLEVVRIPFKGGQFSMIAVLPHARSDLASLEKRIAQGLQLTWLISQLKRKETVLHFPEFRMDTTINFEELLESIETGKSFEKSKAYPNISRRDFVDVRALLQKTVIKVYPGSTHNPHSFLRAKAGMRFDRPFMGYILDESTNTTLMMFRKII